MLSYILDGIEYKQYNHLYAASRCGKFLRKGILVTPKLRHDGYLSIGRQFAHRLVAAVWCNKPDGAEFVHHTNHIKSDNRAENLEWVTPKQHVTEKHHDIIGRQPMPESAKAKLRQFRLGSKHSEETKQKIREASLMLGCRPPARPKGYKCSDEAKTKMRLNSPNAISCVVFGVCYTSMNTAAEALSIKRATLRKRCLSINFPQYQLA